MEESSIEHSRRGWINLFDGTRATIGAILHVMDVIENAL
jgi:hypothetical protein